MTTDERAYFGNEDGQLYVDNPCSVQTVMNGHTDRINCIAYCAELNRIITGSRDKMVRVWDPATGECVHVLKEHGGGVLCAVVHGTTYVWIFLN